MKEHNLSIISALEGEDINQQNFKLLTLPDRTDAMLYQNALSEELYITADADLSFKDITDLLQNR